MKNLKYLVLASFALMAACKSSEKVSKTNPVKEEYTSASMYGDSLFFYMERTPCFGRCPVYTLHIYPDGKMVYEGKQFSKLEGYYTTQVTKEFMNDLALYAKRISYFNLEDTYDAAVTDLPTTITEMWYKDQHHKIINRYGGPDELSKFQNFVDELISGISTWETIAQD